MLCCLALGGLALFGPHGVKLYRALTRRRTLGRSAAQPAEPMTSRHLLVSAPD